MANYNKERGGSRFGGNHSGRPAFKKSWGGGGGGRSGDGPVTLHKATCAECGKVCEVPFRPVSGRPVYCKDCFDKKGGNTGRDRGGDRFPRDFDSRASIKPHFENNRSGDVVTEQLKAVNVKLERLIQAVEALALKKPIEKKQDLQDTLATVYKKNSKKKVVRK